MSTTLITTEKEVLKPVAKTGLNLDEFLAESQAIQSDCQDFNVLVNPNTFRYTEKGGLIYVPNDESKAREVMMSRYAMGQLCTKLGVPSRYIDKCFDSGNTELACDNINAWVSDYGKELFVREYQNTVRGILSNKYSVMDTPEILDVLSDTIDPNEFVTKGYLLTPERFHARIVQKNMMNVEGEDLFAGIQIDSSDVGRSILKVKFFIFKQVCTNGLCISKGGGVLFEQKHIGLTPVQFRDQLTESFSTLPTLIDHAEFFIKHGMQTKSALYDLDSFSSEEEDAVKAFQAQMKLATKLSDDSITQVQSLMTEKYSMNNWGLVNSITEVAQNFTLERRLELENLAGNILYTGKLIA